MKGLIIKQPWIDYILNGSKTWEIRSSKTHIRGTIGLIQSKSGLILGTVEIIGCKELDLETYQNSVDKHCIRNGLDNPPYKRTYAWILNNPIKYEQPKPYKHPRGAVIWVNV